ncbi:MAG: choice-of-anchor D domain-containing protein, partial [Rhodobacteraceae bacterium]|nr:choice-of-anchor D domain-containing protein [Paracoccaceae bacterium]
MNMFPLQAFLTSLKADGFRITMRDYQRIAAVLRTGEVWTLPRLRDTLLVLLAKDVEQQEIFERRFRQFFKADLQEEKILPAIDIQKVLAELQQLAHIKREQKQREEEQKEQEEKKQPPLKPRHVVIKIAAATTFIGVLFAIILGYAVITKPRPAISIQPAFLHFGELAIGEQVTNDFTLENSGTAALTIENIEINGIDEDNFKLYAEYANKAIPPGETLTIPVSFQAAAEGIRGAVLEIASNVEGSPYRLTLSGTGFLKEPVARIAPAFLNFNLQTSGTTSAADLLVINNGRSPLIIDSLTISGRHATNFKLTTEFTQTTLEPGEELIIPVEFEPVAKIEYTAVLKIVDNTKLGLHKIELRGLQIERKRLYADLPYVEQVVPVTLPGDWKPAAVAATGWFALLLFYSIYLRRWRRIPADEPADWNRAEESPRHFPLGSIGGEPAPRFDDEMLNELADSMGYFQSQQTGRVLNVIETIKATIRSGGIPEATFFTRKQVRSLLILEDGLAESLSWNRIAGELAEGMSQRGVKVVSGRFTDSPEHFKTQDGATLMLEDFEDQRQGYLVLIFTDGKRILRRHNRFLLEKLARWPMLAWMEVRESRFWDETSAIPVQYAIPIYPATPQGIFRAIRRFLTEQALEPDDAEQVTRRGEPIRLTDAALEAYIEYLAGEALPWAQECAMLQPSFTIGLADALRREFHSPGSPLLTGGAGGWGSPGIPYEQIERLLALPG